MGASASTAYRCGFLSRAGKHSIKFDIEVNKTALERLYLSEELCIICFRG